VVALTETPDHQFGHRITWGNEHTIIGHREYIETARNLAEKTVGAPGSIYVHALTVDNQDRVIVDEVTR
jgi:hypothetical protein